MVKHVCIYMYYLYLIYDHFENQVIRYHSNAMSSRKSTSDLNNSLIKVHGTHYACEYSSLMKRDEYSSETGATPFN